MRAPVFALLLAASTAEAEPSAVVWSRVVGREPAAAPPLAGPTAALYAACGPRSFALEAVAAELATGGDAASSRPSPAALGRAVQAAGGASPWPRAWSFTGPVAAAGPRFAAWLAPARGVRRCGIAHAVAADGRSTLAALTVDELADVEPVVRRPRLGGWVGLDANLRVDAREVAVVLLGPDGAPRKVPASLTDGRVRSRFALDAPGEWTIQLVATLDSGPEPVAELRLLPGGAAEEGSAPAAAEAAEAAPPARPDDVDSFARLDEARRERGLLGLVRSGALDALARDHAAAMARRGTVAHDLGDGGPVERVRASGVQAGVVGENVARASDAPAAHRALWESPSHRGNMLSTRFRRVGVGVFRDARGVWVTQLFTD